MSNIGAGEISTTSLRWMMTFLFPAYFPMLLLKSLYEVAVVFEDCCLISMYIVCKIIVFHKFRRNYASEWNLGDWWCFIKWLARLMWSSWEKLVICQPFQINEKEKKIFIQRNETICCFKIVLRHASDKLKAQSHSLVPLSRTPQICLLSEWILEVPLEEPSKIWTIEITRRREKLEASAHWFLSAENRLVGYITPFLSGVLYFFSCTFVLTHMSSSYLLYSNSGINFSL